MNVIVMMETMIREGWEFRFTSYPADGGEVRVAMKNTWTVMGYECPTFRARGRDVCHALYKVIDKFERSGLIFTNDPQRSCDEYGEQAE